MIQVPYLLDVLHSIKKSSIDDFLDRVYHYTVLLFLFFAVLISVRNFTSPIECMVPAEYPNTWTTYVKEYCYISSTYIVSSDGATEVRRLTQGYYQWVAFILVIKALLLYLPKLAWKVYIHTQTIDFPHVVEKAKELRYVMGEEHEKGLKDITTYLRERLQHQKTTRDLSSAGFGWKYALSHTISKIFAMIIIFLELSFLNRNFGPEPDALWGITMIKQGLTNTRWEFTGVFPRLTFCDFNQPILGGRYPRRTVQCALPQNMMNEKIFVFVWIWLALLLLLSIFDMFYITMTIFSQSRRRKSVRYFVDLTEDEDVFDLDDSKKEKMIDFACDLFGPDGVYLLACIQLNGGSLIASDIATAVVKELYEETPTEKKGIIVDDEAEKEHDDVFQLPEKEIDVFQLHQREHVDDFQPPQKDHVDAFQLPQKEHVDDYQVPSPPPNE